MSARDFKVLDYTDVQLKKMLMITKYHLSKHPDKQVIKTISELAELINELCECSNKNLVLHGEMLKDLYIEIFDVEFMILQMKILFITDLRKKQFFDQIVDEQLSKELKRRGLE